MKYIEDITKFIFINNEPIKADIIFIHGGLYAEIAETAAKLRKVKYAPIIMPSGKYSIFERTCLSRGDGYYELNNFNKIIDELVEEQEKGLVYM